MIISTAEEARSCAVGAILQEKTSYSFLENCHANSGLQHILNHKGEFISKGINESDIPNFIMHALKENKVVGYQGSGTGRPIYEIRYNGKNQKVAITVGDNGYVVGANPTN